MSGPKILVVPGSLRSAVKLKRLVSAQRGVFIASPEYNASITPLLKNAIDWISAVREAGEPQLAAYQNRVFALGAASPGRSGGMHARPPSSRPWCGGSSTMRA